MSDHETEEHYVTEAGNDVGEYPVSPSKTTETRLRSPRRQQQQQQQQQQLQLRMKRLGGSSATFEGSSTTFLSASFSHGAAEHLDSRLDRQLDSQLDSRLDRQQEKGIAHTVSTGQDSDDSPPTSFSQSHRPRRSLEAAASCPIPAHLSRVKRYGASPAAVVPFDPESSSSSLDGPSDHNAPMDGDDPSGSSPAFASASVSAPQLPTNARLGAYPESTVSLSDDADNDDSNTEHRHTAVIVPPPSLIPRNFQQRRNSNSSIHNAYSSSIDDDSDDDTATTAEDKPRPSAKHVTPRYEKYRQFLTANHGEDPGSSTASNDTRSSTTVPQRSGSDSLNLTVTQQQSDGDINDTYTHGSTDTNHGADTDTDTSTGTDTDTDKLSNNRSSGRSSPTTTQQRSSIFGGPSQFGDSSSFPRTSMVQTKPAINSNEIAQARSVQSDASHRNRQSVQSDVLNDDDMKIVNSMLGLLDDSEEVDDDNDDSSSSSSSVNSNISNGGTIDDHNPDPTHRSRNVSSNNRTRDETSGDNMDADNEISYTPPVLISPADAAESAMSAEAILSADGSVSSESRSILYTTDDDSKSDHKPIEDSSLSSKKSLSVATAGIGVGLTAAAAIGAATLWQQSRGDDGSPSNGDENDDSGRPRLVSSMDRFRTERGVDNDAETTAQPLKRSTTTSYRSLSDMTIKSDPALSDDMSSFAQASAVTVPTSNVVSRLEQKRMDKQRAANKLKGLSGSIARPKPEPPNTSASGLMNTSIDSDSLSASRSSVRTQEQTIRAALESLNRSDRADSGHTNASLKYRPTSPENVETMNYADDAYDAATAGLAAAALAGVTAAAAVTMINPKQKYGDASEQGTASTVEKAGRGAIVQDVDDSSCNSLVFESSASSTDPSMRSESILPSSVLTAQDSDESMEIDFKGGGGGMFVSRPPVSNVSYESDQSLQIESILGPAPKSTSMSQGSDGSGSLCGERPDRNVGTLSASDNERSAELPAPASNAEKDGSCSIQSFSLPAPNEMSMSVNPQNKTVLRDLSTKEQQKDGSFSLDDMNAFMDLNKGGILDDFAQEVKARSSSESSHFDPYGNESDRQSEPVEREIPSLGPVKLRKPPIISGIYRNCVRLSVLLLLSAAVAVPAYFLIEESRSTSVSREIGLGLVVEPSMSPSMAPSYAPSLRPIVGGQSGRPADTLAPSTRPSLRPSLQVSESPSHAPTLSPTATASFQPTGAPSAVPYSATPSTTPSHVLSLTPTPSTVPSVVISAIPTDNDVSASSQSPTVSVSQPSVSQQSLIPTTLQSETPSIVGSSSPSSLQSSTPSESPSVLPTTQSMTGSLAPQSQAPTRSPVTAIPTARPSFVPTLLPTNNISETPSLRPSEMDPVAMLRTTLLAASPALEPMLNRPDSAQSLAFQWLSTTSNFESFTPEKQLQRFVLAVLYNLTNGGSWTENSLWLSEQDECLWYTGTTRDPCDESGLLVILQLGLNNLDGVLPAELALLSNSLRVIDLSRTSSDGSLRGRIPPEYGALTNLSVFDVSGNDISDVIPSEIGNWIDLEVLNISNNMMVGLLPSAIGQLRRLTFLDISGNSFAGQLPDSIIGLTRIQNLILAENNFVGPIPTVVGLLSSIENLNVSGNQFSELPSQIGQLKSMRTLLAADNDMAGPLPTELGSLDTLLSLDLSDNTFTGPIPSELGSLAAVRDKLDLSSNQLSGPIPLELGNLSLLRELNLQDNSLSGGIPSEMSGLTSVVRLRLETNDLTEEVPLEVCMLFNSIVPEFSTDCLEELVCTCCLFCCRDSGGCECQFIGTDLEFLCNQPLSDTGPGVAEQIANR